MARARYMANVAGRRYRGCVLDADDYFQTIMERLLKGAPSQWKVMRRAIIDLNRATHGRVESKRAFVEYKGFVSSSDPRPFGPNPPNPLSILIAIEEYNSILAAKELKLRKHKSYLASKKRWRDRKRYAARVGKLFTEPQP
jgi:hypothetical protein